MYSHNYTFCVATPKQLQTDPKWKQANYNRSIAQWLQACREGHNKICSCGTFRSHWHQAVLPGTTRGTQTDQDTCLQTATQQNQIARLFQAAEPEPRLKRRRITFGTSPSTTSETVHELPQDPKNGGDGNTYAVNSVSKPPFLWPTSKCQTLSASDRTLQKILLSPQTDKVSDTSFIWKPYEWGASGTGGGGPGALCIGGEGEDGILADDSDIDTDSTGMDTDEELAALEECLRKRSMTLDHGYSRSADPIPNPPSHFDSRGLFSFLQQ